MKAVEKLHLEVRYFKIIIMQNKQLMLLLKYAAIAGNIIFILWILFNGINEGFKGTLVEKFSYAGLIGLLAINSILLGSRRPQTE